MADENKEKKKTEFKKEYVGDAISLERDNSKYSVRLVKGTWEDNQGAEQTRDFVEIVKAKLDSSGMQRGQTKSLWIDARHADVLANALKELAPTE